MRPCLTNFKIKLGSHVNSDAYILKAWCMKRDCFASAKSLAPISSIESLRDCDDLPSINSQNEDLQPWTYSDYWGLLCMRSCWLPFHHLHCPLWAGDGDSLQEAELPTGRPTISKQDLHSPLNRSLFCASSTSSIAGLHSAEASLWSSAIAHETKTSCACAQFKRMFKLFVMLL